MNNWYLILQTGSMPKLVALGVLDNKDSIQSAIGSWNSLQDISSWSKGQDCHCDESTTWITLLSSSCFSWKQDDFRVSSTGNNAS